MNEAPLILIVDDEEDVRELVGINLRKAGFQTDEAGDGLSALLHVGERKPAAIVLDVMMPGQDGLQVCQLLRGNPETSQIPIIMLTARGQAEDRILGLEKGADDYLSKPFSPKELVLRVGALLRRASIPMELTVLCVGPFRFELIAVRLLVSEVVVDVTLLEFRLLHLLASNHGVTVERARIMNEVWGYADNVHSRTLDTHVKRVREKLKAFSGWVQTSRGTGYLFKEPVLTVEEVM